MSPGEDGRRRCSRSFLTFLAALVAVLATVLSSASASAATTGTTAETRVLASAVAFEVPGGPPEHIGAGQRLGNGPPQAQAAVATGVAANSADNVANGVRLGQQLARESAESAFTSSGRLSSGAIAESRQIPGSKLGNKDLIQRLTADGSSIAGWGKFTTRTHQSPSGDFQVHFYMNRVTGAIDYGYDYKVIFNGMPR